ncbi:BhlA/UviB family holin-like peptide [Brevibacillus porteri]|uniref:Uncharacterized protein n=2 Tax=Brevibacillus TaxID=55080 RepID=A0A517IA71_BREBE|nr:MULTISPECIES: BhlA/UviB family holin-like peptide [Brevibacillus]ATF11692.1 hypothetical protein A616_06740 [Brevibacillus brevis X23]MED1913734.1 BhlA/UviB family holin-like peptide [Bacillus thuringiensis]MDC0763191.1 BhlA/UviB family holin-like peptide [Brevibacillus sp. AG]MED1800603.1 BhlA/UviB family holin-like peptide [Brevibacillus porteri]MED2134769.1 BhlA/UviB family holin-like peptide [Brevibacillus porteri]
MEDQVTTVLLQQGPFAALFVWLLFYIMKANREREGRLQDLLDKYSDKYDLILEELREIKGKVKK